jgi:hypothetical protein
MSVAGVDHLRPIEEIYSNPHCYKDIIYKNVINNKKALD